VRHPLRLSTPPEDSDVEGPTSAQRDKRTSYSRGELDTRDADEDRAGTHAKTLATPDAGREGPRSLGSPALRALGRNEAQSRHRVRPSSFTAPAKNAGKALAAGTIARRAQWGRVPWTRAWVSTA